MKKKKLKKERRNIMSTVSDSADEFVKLTLEGFEVMARISGSMVKNVAIMLYTISKDTSKKTKGKTKLSKMLKDKSPLKVFSMKQEDYLKFQKQAKRYGILYCSLFNKKDKDGMVDIIAREDDAVRVDRIIERFKLTSVDLAKVESELDKTEQAKVENKQEEKPEIEKSIQEKNTSDDLMNLLLKKQNIKEENENINPSQLPSSEKNSPSENLLKQNEKNEGIKKEEKPSIHEKLEDIKEQKAKEEQEKTKVAEEIKETPKQEKVNETKHQQPEKKNKKKERNK